MSRLAGAQVERPPGKKYASALRFAEIRPPLPVPRAGTLQRWREGLADDFELALEAPMGAFRGDLGELRIDEGVKERVVWLREALGALPRPQPVPPPEHLELVGGVEVADHRADHELG